jgi:hypothetical protein
MREPRLDDRGPGEAGITQPHHELLDAGVERFGVGGSVPVVHRSGERRRCRRGYGPAEENTDQTTAGLSPVSGGNDGLVRILLIILVILAILALAGVVFRGRRV